MFSEGTVLGHGNQVGMLTVVRDESTHDDEGTQAQLMIVQELK